MAEHETKTYRHTVTGLVSELDPSVAAAFPDVLVEVGPDAKPLVPITTLVERNAQAKRTTTKKEQKDG